MFSPFESKYYEHVSEIAQCQVKPIKCEMDNQCDAIFFAISEAKELEESIWQTMWIALTIFAMIRRFGMVKDLRFSAYFGQWIANPFKIKPGLRLNGRTAESRKTFVAFGEFCSDGFIKPVFSKTTESVARVNAFEGNCLFSKHCSRGYHEDEARTFNCDGAKIAI
ncbi:hypothetical protein [Zavarzinella formosa]|uniref:hypothetical protein n=1 Tax=Zavarzinella formosa TaxID=360055 RepID=UPI000497B3A9|nr:hypothetical protein [Zavarzinella formosa]